MEKEVSEMTLILPVHRNQLKTRCVMSTEAQATLIEDIGNQVCIVSCACVLCVLCIIVISLYTSLMDFTVG